MDVSWDEVARFFPPPPGKHLINSPATCLAFDNFQELLWAGNAQGRVTSFGANVERYTSFKAGLSHEGAVQQILFCNTGVIALIDKGVHMALRTGVPIWHIQHENMRQLRCMSFTSNRTSELLVAGLQDVMFVIDVNKGEIVRQLPTKSHYTQMKRSRYICAAVHSPNMTVDAGYLHVLDATTFAVVKQWQAHAGGISDFDAQHDFIVCCGFVSRHAAQYLGQNSNLVSVFDLKNLKSSLPISFPAGAARVRMHPRMSTTAIIASSTGIANVIDVMNVNTAPTAGNMRQISCAPHLINLMEIASTGEAIAFCAGDCSIQLWGSPGQVRFTDSIAPIEREDYHETPLPLGWNNDIPLNTIGMPYYRETLLSAWPGHMVFEVGAPPVKFDQVYINSLETVAWFKKGPNSRKLRRNQTEKTRKSDTSAGIQAPKFLSEKARDTKGHEIERRISDVADAMAAAELSTMKADVPIQYRNVEIKYSKFGVEDFDFGYYNKTKYSGLETHISNSYANPLLQILHFTPLFRNLALRHTATACIDESCLLCEMGFLFDMLEKADGAPCQATNLLKTLSNQSQASQLGLLEEDSAFNSNGSISTNLQGLNRFLMERLSQNCRNHPSNAFALDQLLITNGTTHIKCAHCRNEHTRNSPTFVNELAYPSMKTNLRQRMPKITFSNILRASIERSTKDRGWCSRCQRYQQLENRKAISSLPPVLLLNAAINTPEAKMLWGTPGWLPDEIGIIIDERGNFFAYEGDEIKIHLQRRQHRIQVYSLVGLAADIESGQHQKSHLVSLINVGLSHPTITSENNWHLFNDFLVRPIKKEEALSFDTNWKTPSIIAYQIKEGNNKIDDTWKQTLDTALLYTDNAAMPMKQTYTPLSQMDEKPIQGSIIAIDTEFVQIRQPEIEMTASGERAIVRPIAYALARVSVLRGPSEAFSSNLDPGTPFIDDYVKKTEAVTDYLTSYSGIEAGDLDPHTSKHHLVPLKVAYKKLWILLNLGCVFLGHGLKQDFRVTNIHVPKAQVLDTAEFFFLRERFRKLSLAFLAWAVLHEDIQTGNHDSIEDARSALSLYLKYREYTDAGIMETMLRDIYAKGTEVNFKAPGRGVVGESAVEAGDFATPGKK